LSKNPYYFRENLGVDDSSSFPRLKIRLREIMLAFNPGYLFSCDKQMIKSFHCPTKQTRRTR